MSKILNRWWVKILQFHEWTKNFEDRSGSIPSLGENPFPFVKLIYFDSYTYGILLQVRMQL